MSTWVTVAVHFRFPDGSGEQRNVFVFIDDCGPDACRNCIHEVTGYTCDRDEDLELMQLVDGSVSVAKECETLEHVSVEPT